MANSYQVIDEETWEGAMHCRIFRNIVEPAFCVTFTADIPMLLYSMDNIYAHLSH